MTTTVAAGAGVKGKGGHPSQRIIQSERKTQHDFFGADFVVFFPFHKFLWLLFVIALHSHTLPSAFSRRVLYDLSTVELSYSFNFVKSLMLANKRKASTSFYSEI